MEIIHISDTHDLLKTVDILKKSDQNMVTFLTGDNTKNYYEYVFLRDYLVAENYDTFHILGNHDMWNNDTNTLLSYSFREIGFDYQIREEALIISLDLPFGILPDNTSSTNDLDKNLLVNGIDVSWRDEIKVRSMKNYYFRICQAFIERIIEIVNKHDDFKKVIILSHVPFITTWKENDELSSFFSAPEMSEFMMEFARTHYDKEFHIFSGHVHKNYDVQIGNIIQHVSYTSGDKVRIINV